MRLRKQIVGLATSHYFENINKLLQCWTMCMSLRVSLRCCIIKMVYPVQLINYGNLKGATSTVSLKKSEIVDSKLKINWLLLFIGIKIESTLKERWSFHNKHKKSQRNKEN